VAGEVVVVDNGSTDGSPEIAARAGARVVHEPQRGYGAAYLRGFAEARGRYIVMGDADDTYDFLELERFVEPLASGSCDLVMGNRLHAGMLPGAMPWSHRWIGNPILSGMLRLFFHTRVRDSHCGMRSFTREAYERMRLRTTGMELASEIVVNALRQGLRIREVPIIYRPRIGESKLRGLHDAWRHVRFMLLFSPSYLFRLPGLVLTGAGAILTLLLARGPGEFLGRTWDFHVLLFAALALILGYNLILFDLFARVYSIGAGYAEADRFTRWVMRFFSLERSLVVGGLLFLLGLGLEVKIVLDWLASGGAALMAVRGVTLGMVAMVLGAQTAFASFLVGLLRLEHR